MGILGDRILLIFERESGMHLFISFMLLTVSVSLAEELPYFHVIGGDVGAWGEILGAIGMEAKPMEEARVFVARAGAPASAEWAAGVEGGAFLILEGQSSLAEQLGFRGGQTVIRLG